MAFASIVLKPRVIEQGGAVVRETSYVVNHAAADWKAGDLLRLNSNGTVELVADAASQKVLGMALEDVDVSASEGAFAKVLVFAEDTVLEAQYNSASAPTQALVGDQVDMSCVSGAFAVDTTTSNAIVEITDIWKNSNWFRTGDNEAGAYGLVRFKILPAALAAAANTASS